MENTQITCQEGNSFVLGNQHVVLFQRLRDVYLLLSLFLDGGLSGLLGFVEPNEFEVGDLVHRF